MRWLLALFCLSFITVSQATAMEPLDGKVIEKVLVLKSAHQLQLINDGKPFKTYRISLGKRPKGPKLMEGDKRTPRRFLLDRLAQGQRPLQPGDAHFLPEYH